MKRVISGYALLLALVFPLIAAAASPSSHFLFRWVMESQRPHASVPETTPGDIPARRNGL